MNRTSSYDCLLKLMIIGDSAVGKTSLLLRFADDSFSETFIATIGIDFKVKTLRIDGKKVKLQIWDTAGQERFQTLTASYYRGAMGILLVYDITKPKTLENIEKWMCNIAEHSNKDVILFLIGAKADLEDQRTIPYETGLKMAQKFNMPFYETSAKNNTNVANVFYEITKKIYKIQQQKESLSRNSGGVFQSHTRSSTQNNSVLASFNTSYNNMDPQNGNRSDCCM